MIPRYDGLLVWAISIAIDLALFRSGWFTLGGFWLGCAVAQSDFKLVDRWRKNA